MKSRGRSPVLAAPPPTASSTAAAASSLVTSMLQRGGTNRGSVSGRSSSDHGDHSLLTLPKASSDSGSEGILEGASPIHRPMATASTIAAEEAYRTPDSSALGNSIFYGGNEPDAVSLASAHSTPADPATSQKVLDQIQGKIEKTKELIREEQTSRDDNVNEYLKLSSNADRQQQARIKQVFEKKNQKSAQNIINYQKKLEEYQKKMQDIQEHGVKPKQTHKLGQGLKNVRDGISGMSNTVMSKPKEFAHLLRHKFGSADDLNALTKDASTASGDKNHHGSASLPRENSGGGLSSGGATQDHRHRKSSFEGRGKRKCISDDGRRSERSASVATSGDSNEQNAVARGSGVSPQRILAGGASGGGELPAHQEAEQENHHYTEWKAVMQELMLHKEEVDHLREEIDELRQHFKQEIETLSYQLREERDRYDRLEEQMNDLTELHQHEIENIKSVVNDMEEKVQYQSEERLLDIKEHLQSLETKVTSMEHQQVQQQYLYIEGLDSTDARAVMMKLLTFVITVVHFFLFVMGTLMNLTRPFLRTTVRAVVTLAVVVIAGWVYYQQDAIWATLHKFKLLSKSELPQ